MIEEAREVLEKAIEDAGPTPTPAIALLIERMRESHRRLAEYDEADRRMLCTPDRQPAQYDALMATLHDEYVRFWTYRDVIEDLAQAAEEPRPGPADLLTWLEVQQRRTGEEMDRARSEYVRTRTIFNGDPGSRAGRQLSRLAGRYAALADVARQVRDFDRQP